MLRVMVRVRVRARVIAPHPSSARLARRWCSAWACSEAAWALPRAPGEM